MDNRTRKVIILLDGKGRETDRPSSFVSIGAICEKITRTVGQTRLRNDNMPVWDAAVHALPVKKEGS